MIDSTSPSNRTPQLPQELPSSTKGSSPAKQPASDSVSLSNIDFLKAQMASEPEIRPSVLERARALAADPGYPPLSVMRSVAGQILASPDLLAQRAAAPK